MDDRIAHDGTAKNPVDVTNLVVMEVDGELIVSDENGRYPVGREYARAAQIHAYGRAESPLLRRRA